MALRHSGQPNVETILNTFRVFPTMREAKAHRKTVSFLRIGITGTMTGIRLVAVTVVVLHIQCQQQQSIVVLDLSSPYRQRDVLVVVLVSVTTIIARDVANPKDCLVDSHGLYHAFFMIRIDRHDFNSSFSSFTFGRPFRHGRSLWVFAQA